MTAPRESLTNFVIAVQCPARRENLLGISTKVIGQSYLQNAPGMQ